MAITASVMTSSAIEYDMQDLIADIEGRYMLMAEEADDEGDSRYRLLLTSKSRIRACTSPDPRYIVWGMSVPPRIAQLWYSLDSAISLCS